MHSIEMQVLSKEKNKFLTSVKNYQKFPFFIGERLSDHVLDINAKPFTLDVIAWLASAAYKLQAKEARLKSVDRFWSKGVTLADLCCKSLALTLLNNPDAYLTRAQRLPKELNDRLNQKLKAVEQGIAYESDVQKYLDDINALVTFNLKVPS